VKSILYKIYTPIALIGNALGNAALVVIDSISAWSISGAIGCFLNSWSGNILEPDIYQSQKNQLVKELFKETQNFNQYTKGDTKCKPNADSEDLPPKDNSGALSSAH